MRPIQFILIILLAGLVWLYLSRLRSRLLDRLIVVLFGVIGVIMVLMPDATSTIAHYLGVGRGADLLLYLGLIGLTFVSFILFSRQREMQASITELARAIALQNARRPEDALDEEDAAQENLPPANGQ
jgi:small membrane protein